MSIPIARPDFTTIKTDAEIAADFRSRIIAAYEPILILFTEAKRAGFEVMTSSGADATGQVFLTGLTISKIF